MQLQKINTLEINWVLSGDDFTIDLNNPNNPKFIILGSHPTIRTADKWYEPAVVRFRVIVSFLPITVILSDPYQGAIRYDPSVYCL